jgi:hypothetical protein
MNFSTESDESMEEKYEEDEGMKSSEAELTKILLMRAFVEKQDPSSKVRSPSMHPPIFFCLHDFVFHFLFYVAFQFDGNQTPFYFFW